jgi:hypothetical protein
MEEELISFCVSLFGLLLFKCKFRKDKYAIVIEFNFSIFTCRDQIKNSFLSKSFQVNSSIQHTFIKINFTAKPAQSPPNS